MYKHFILKQKQVFHFLLTLIAQIFVLSSLAQTSGEGNKVSGESKFKAVSLSKIPKPASPPILAISDISFSDKAGNNNSILDADERAEINFVVENKGLGDAFSLVLKVEEKNSVSGLQFSKELPKGNLPAGNKISVRIPLSALSNIPSAKAEFHISIKEGNNFNPDPFDISVNTLQFKEPKIIIADALFTNQKEEGKISLGEKVQLDIIIKNTGEGEARNVKVEFINPANVFPGNKNIYRIPFLKPNEQLTFNYEFFANKQYQDTTIPINVKITEEYGKYGVNESKTVSLDQSLTKSDIKKIEIKGEQEVIRDTKPALLVSDVDRNIPASPNTYKNRRALIIGNEEYSKFQTELESEVNVDFAKNDAKVFRDYCIQTLGIAPSNIDYVTDATSSKMRQSINRINQLMKNNNDLEIIFYYAGHGLPDPVSKEPYLIPVDVNGSNLESAIKLKDVYKKFSEFGSERVTAFIDACFSGGARNQELTKDRAIKIAPTDEPLSGKLVVFTASSGTQTSMAYKDQKHGMFTYFLLKALQDSKGDITYAQLAESVKKNVSFSSVDINRKEQNPQVNASSAVADSWSTWKIIK